MQASGELINTLGESFSWTLEDGVLTINGRGEMDVPHLVDEEEGWFDTYWQEAESIEKVVLSQGITVIGEYAFRELAHLKEVAKSSPP